ncbi:MAG: hypothetical protein WCC99_18215 [Candidatus Sulfotelmatobacter sp.]
MHFWRENFFQTLKDAAADAATVPEWADYGAFCTEYERGLRREAFTTLERFICSFEHAPFAERRRFVSWLLLRADGRDGRHMLVPHPLRLRIVEPTLLEWTVVEPECSEPHRWLGGYDHLRRAIELQPDDELARKKLVAYILGRVTFAAHELPTGYLGVAREDLATLMEAEGLLAGLSSGDERQKLAAEIVEHRAVIQEYLRKSQQS